MLARYRSGLADKGVTLDEHTAHEQYRLFSVYSWIAAASTAAMGAQWQPIDVCRAGPGEHDAGHRRSRCGRACSRSG